MALRPAGRGRAQHGLGDVDVGDLGELGREPMRPGGGRPARGCDGKTVAQCGYVPGVPPLSTWLLGVSWVCSMVRHGISLARPVARWPVTYRSSRIRPLDLPVEDSLV